MSDYKLYLIIAFGMKYNIKYAKFYDDKDTADNVYKKLIEKYDFFDIESVIDVYGGKVIFDFAAHDNKIGYLALIGFDEDIEKIHCVFTNVGYILSSSKKYIDDKITYHSQFKQGYKFKKIIEINKNESIEKI